MEKTKEAALQYFAPLYILNKLFSNDGLNNPEKYKNDPVFLEQMEKLTTQDAELIEEISVAATDTTDRYKNIWDKVETLLQESPQKAKNGAKLEYLKSLNSYKKGKKIMKKKCKCGCDMVDVKEAGGKIVSKCACGCDTKKVKMKSKGGVLEDSELDNLLGFGIINSSVVNKWERKINSKRVNKFKK